VYTLLQLPRAVEEKMQARTVRCQKFLFLLRDET